MENSIATMEEDISSDSKTHKLYDNWTMWAHLPHDTDWTVNHNNKGEWYKMYESDDHPSYYNNEKSRMNAVRSLTMHNYDWQGHISEIKHYRWEESDEGKAEIQAENERHQEMMTFMGESGLHSYSIDSEGTYTMWR